jgi:hypothetical protein
LLSFLNSSLVNPTVPSVSVKSTGIGMRLAFPLSVNNMLQRRDMSKVTRYGVCICTFAGAPRGTNLDASWLDTAFSDAMGVASYFRKMSGGRKFVEWQVFGPIDLMTLVEKQNLDRIVPQPQSTIDGFQRAATAKGIPVSSFDHFVWIIDDNISTAGTTTNDSLVGGVDFTPQLSSHEMTHAFGVHYHADRKTDNDYADPFCMMGNGWTARSFENSRIANPNPSGVSRSPGFPHTTTGPGIITPYLYQAKWLDYTANVNNIQFNSLGEPTGTLTGSLYANQGAPPVRSPKKIALTIGGIPQTTEDPPQYWIEYRLPYGFDLGICRPVSTTVNDLPPEGVLVLHKVSFEGTLHSYVIDWIAVKKDNILKLPESTYVIKITNLDLDNPQVFYSLVKSS